MRPISTILRSVALSTLAGLAATSSACLSEVAATGRDGSASPAPDTSSKDLAAEGFLPVPCELGDDTITDLGSVRSLLGADYLGVHLAWGSSYEGGPTTFTSSARSGVCATDECKEGIELRMREALARVESTAGAAAGSRQWSFAAQTGPVARAIVLVRGATVTMVGTDDELRSLLGSIDSPWKAHLWLYATTDGTYDTSCKRAVGGDPEQNYVRAGNPNQVTAITTVPGDACGADANTFRVILSVDASGVATENERLHLWTGPTGCVGRFPEGVSRDQATAVLQAGFADEGAYFAHMAYAEEAAVHAFATLAEELAAHGAPSDLIADLDRARQDEIRHTRMATKLARSWGRDPVRPTVTRAPRLRSLEEVALENAVEGCVRETYGAVLGVHQGATAAKASVRTVMARVAEDELRHADVSWRLAEWLDAQLDEDARARVREARDEAIVALRRQLQQDVVFGANVGLPDAETALGIHARLTREVWRA